MKQRVITLLLCVVLIFTCSFSVSADTPRIVDETGTLSAEQQASLEEKARNLVDTYQMDVVILMVNDLDGKSTMAYADDYFDYNGYGIGSDSSGILFLISLEGRDWHISTCGKAIRAFTDHGIQSLFSDVAGYLKNDDFYGAFDAYLNLLPRYFDAYEQGKPIDSNGGSSAREKHPFTFVNVLVGIVVACVALYFMSRSMNTRKKQNSASDYLATGTFHLSVNENMFLHSSISKSRKQTSSSGGSGGGSSTHTSSSGRSHGGGGGKF